MIKEENFNQVLTNTARPTPTTLGELGEKPALREVVDADEVAAPLKGGFFVTR